MRWTYFMGKRMRELPLNERGIYQKRAVSSAVQTLVAAVKVGDLDIYESHLRYLWYWRGEPFQGTDNPLMRIWKEFRQKERYLFTEILLSR